jgi:hypothetical protein
LHCDRLAKKHDVMAFYLTIAINTCPVLALFQAIQKKHDVIAFYLTIAINIINICPVLAL